MGRTLSVGAIFPALFTLFFDRARILLYYSIRIDMPSGIFMKEETYAAFYHEFG